MQQEPIPHPLPFRQAQGSWFGMTPWSEALRSTRALKFFRQKRNQYDDQRGKIQIRLRPPPSSTAAVITQALMVLGR